MPAIQVFIPRIVGGITSTFLKQSFKQLNVGNVTHLDMRSRLNSNNYAYSFAFLTVELFENDFAARLFQKLKQTGHAQLAYDEYNYWEIKDYIPRDKRTNPLFEVDIEAPPVETDIEAPPQMEQTVIHIEDDEPEWMGEPVQTNKMSITQLSKNAYEFATSWMNQSVNTPKCLSASEKSKLLPLFETPKCLPAPEQSKFLPLFDAPKCLPIPEPSIQSLCDELLHYKPWTYPQPNIDAQHHAYYPSKYLSNDTKDYDDIQRDINAVIHAQNVYRLF